MNVADAVVPVKQRIDFVDPKSITDPAMRAELYRHFPQPQIVELGFFIGLTMGQQRWNRLLNIEHNKFMAGDSGGLAPALSQGTA